MSDLAKQRRQNIDDLTEKFIETLEILDAHVETLMKTHMTRVESEESTALDQLKYFRNQASKPLDFIERTAIALRAVLPSWIKVTHQITAVASKSTQSAMRLLHNHRNLSSLGAFSGSLGYEINLYLRFDDRRDLPADFCESPFSMPANVSPKVYEWITTLMYPIRRDIKEWGVPVKLTSGEQSNSTSVTISSPWGIAIHPSTGHIYTTDHNNPVIYIWTHEQDGNLKNLVRFKEESGGGRKSGLLVNPRGIAISKQGRVAIADYGGCRLTLMTSDLKLIRHVAEVNSSISRMTAPYNVVFDQDDNIYLSDSGNQRVLKFNHEGEYLYEIRTRNMDCTNPILQVPHGEKLFKSSVNGVSVDEKGRVFVLTSGGDVIRVFKSNGSYDFDIPIKTFGSGGWGFLARGPKSTVVVSDYNNSHIRFYNYSGELVSQIDCRGPLGCVFDPTGRFYFVQHDASTLMCV